MKEVIIKHNKANHKRYFVNPDSDSSIMCMFRDRSCSPDCAACSIEVNPDQADKVICERAANHFSHFAYIVDDETDYGDEDSE